MRIKINICIILFFGLLQAQDFVLPVMPDTQAEVGTNDPMYYNRFDWLIKHDNIPMVLHVGDLVNYNNYVHWENASKGYDVLDKVNMKYAIAVGNHDCAAVNKHNGSAAPGYTNHNLRITDKFNSYFPTYRFKGQRGRMEPFKSDNAYSTFKFEDTNWLVVVLEFCPRYEAIAWADKVIAEHPEYNVIVLTHYYLNPDTTIGQDNQGYGDLSPQFMFDHLLVKHENIKLVLSGHKCGFSYRKDVGEKGNTFYSVLQNYQCKDKGGGYISLLSFDLKNESVTAEMYSPHYNKKKGDKLILNNIDFIHDK